MPKRSENGSGDCPNFRGHRPGTIDRWSALVGRGRRKWHCPLSAPENALIATKIKTGPGSGAEVRRANAADRGVLPLTGVPRWDPARRELWLGDFLIKRFRQPSPNQERILAVFQEEGWPPSIDDPLPYQADQDSKRRLHDTIHNLNRCQRNCLIHFSGDGTGERILWRLLADAR